MIIDFLKNNWIDLLLIMVGFVALLVYGLQERKKKIEAASLVLLQIDEIQEKIKTIQTFITDGRLDEIAFYESEPLLDESYWNKYKHLFVRKMDIKSFRTLNSFYDCAHEMFEQQQLMKNLQKNFFFVTQQAIINLESNYIITDLNNSTKFPVDIKQLVSGIERNIPETMNDLQKNAFMNMLCQVAASNGNNDFSTFWKSYNQNCENIRTIINRKGLTPYIPEQIRQSLEKAIKQYSLLEITGCDGYRILKKIAGKRF